MSQKYPRTMHLPWSPGASKDDRIADDISILLNTPIVISEKLDGSNVCLEKDGCFARTHAGPPTHASFDGLKALHASVKHNIDANTQYFGEWCYAKHSIKYDSLPGYFLLFAVRYGDIWERWDCVLGRATALNISTVPVLWAGEVDNEQELKALTIELATQKSSCGGEREGVVVRASDEFHDKDFSKCIMKYVRKNHVQTSEHWRNQEIVRNGLK